MALKSSDVKKPDIHFPDAVVELIGKGVKVVATRLRVLKFNFWKGNVEVSESITTYELRDK